MVAAAASVTPELPTEIPGVGSLAFFKAKDAQYFEEEDKTELSVEEHTLKDQERHLLVKVIRLSVHSQNCRHH